MNKKVLISAYSCEPFRGSEPGVAWDLIQELSKKVGLIVVTRDDKRDIILKNDPGNIEWHFVGLPSFKKPHAYSPLGFIHYYLWQIYMGLYVRMSIPMEKYRLAHHVTFVSSWTPSGLVFQKRPFIWGPIGHHSRVPNSYMARTSFWLRKKELLRTLIKFSFNLLDPLLWITKIRASRIYVINDDVARSVGFFDKTFIKPAIALRTDITTWSEPKQHMDGKNGKLRLYWAGNIVYWKGIYLLLDVMSQLRNDPVELILIGDGHEKSTIEDIIVSRGLENVVLRPRQSQEELMRFIQDFDVFFYPSFEGGGMVVLEAMFSSKPVIGLKFGGCGEMVEDAETGFLVEYTNYKEVVDSLENKIKLYIDDRNLVSQHGKTGKERVRDLYSIESKASYFYEVYSNV